MRPLEANDAVVLPSGQRGTVVRRLADGRVEVRYLERRARAEQTVVLPCHLVRRIERGLVPPPVRINGSGHG